MQHVALKTWPAKAYFQCGKHPFGWPLTGKPGRGAPDLTSQGQRKQSGVPAAICCLVTGESNLPNAKTCRGSSFFPAAKQMGQKLA